MRARRAWQRSIDELIREIIETLRLAAEGMVSISKAHNEQLTNLEKRVRDLENKR